MIFIKPGTQMAKRNVRYIYTVPFCTNFFYAIIFAVNTFLNTAIKVVTQK